MNVSYVTKNFMFTLEDNYIIEKDALLEDSYLSEIYTTSLLHYVIYSLICSLQGIIGIVGNILTLIIILTLKSRTNVHILMIYLAVADILVSSQFPLGMNVHVCL